MARRRISMEKDVKLFDSNSSVILANAPYLGHYAYFALWLRNILKKSTKKGSTMLTLQRRTTTRSQKLLRAGSRPLRVLGLAKKFEYFC